MGGLIVSQIMTLYLTPVVYTYMAKFQARNKSEAPAITPQPATGFGD